MFAGVLSKELLGFLPLIVAFQVNARSQHALFLLERGELRLRLLDFLSHHGGCSGVLGKVPLVAHLSRHNVLLQLIHLLPHSMQTLLELLGVEPSCRLRRYRSSLHQREPSQRLG